MDLDSASAPHILSPQVLDAIATAPRYATGNTSNPWPRGGRTTAIAFVIRPVAGVIEPVKPAGPGYGSAPQLTGAGTLARRSVIHCCESAMDGKKARS